MATTAPAPAPAPASVSSVASNSFRYNHNVNPRTHTQLQLGPWSGGLVFNIALMHDRDHGDSGPFDGGRLE